MARKMQRKVEVLRYRIKKKAARILKKVISLRSIVICEIVFAVLVTLTPGANWPILLFCLYVLMIFVYAIIYECEYGKDEDSFIVNESIFQKTKEEYDRKILEIVDDLFRECEIQESKVKEEWRERFVRPVFLRKQNLKSKEDQSKNNRLQLLAP